MSKRNLMAVTITCLNALAPLFFLFSQGQALRPFLEKDPTSAFFLGLVIGLSLALPAMVLGISISEGEF